MNREIKFRGKCVPDSKYAGEWVTGGYVAPESDCKKQDEGLIISYYGGNTQCVFHVIPDTVGQFTGLKDKNGQEIFEGDIINTAFSTRAFGVVTWNEDGYFFIDVHFGKYDKFNDEYSTLGHMLRVQIDGKPIDIEVIGNIHENPELMKGGRQ